MKSAIGLCLALVVGCAYEVDGGDLEEVGSVTSPISNPIGGGPSYPRGLVRIDLPGGGRCSGFFIGPNMIATAAHCVNDRVNSSPRGTWNGMGWGEISVRVVYKPTPSEVMCINETCRNSSGTTRRTTMLAWWDAAYSGDGDTASDIAVLTRVNGRDFPTRAPDVGDPAPPSLNSGDYLRVLRNKVSTSVDGYVWGYGAFNDTSTDSNPRVGWVETQYWGPSHVRGDADRESRICAGDSGGPLIFNDGGVFGPNYAAGVASNTSDRSGRCPERGDAMRWTRLGPKVWMFNRILDWADRGFCLLYPGSDVPGSDHYYRCW